MTLTTGHYEQIQGRPVVRFERTFPHPVDSVWAALTDPAQLQRWFPTTVQWSRLRPGAPISFEFADDRYPAMSGEVTDVQPSRRLAFTWGDDELTFELEPRERDSACRLVLSVALDAADKAARDAAGWDDCLDGLEQVVDGRPAQRPAPSHRWRSYYEEYQRLGLPASAPLPE